MKIINPNRFRQIPDAILFDTDDTLYPYQPAHQAALKVVQEKIVNSFSISEAQFEKLFANARAQVKERIKNTASSHSRLLYMQKMLELLGQGSQVLLALELEQAYWQSFLANATLFSGVKEFLDYLKLRKIPIAIVTDLTAKIQFQKMVHFGLHQHFDYVVTSEEAGFDKPHEAPYKLALEKIKPNGSLIWMIGDNPVNDIAGAREKIGAVTLQKIHSGVSMGTGKNQPDAHFSEYSQLLDFFFHQIEPSHSPSEANFQL